MYGNPVARTAKIPAARTAEERGTRIRFASGEIQLMRLK
jgi:hypothetical protein